MTVKNWYELILGAIIEGHRRVAQHFVVVWRIRQTKYGPGVC